MKSLILRTSTRYLLPLLILYSLFLLVEGHHEPGGGFVGGLLAAAAMGLCALAYDVPAARRIVRVAPARLIAAGLLAIGTSGFWGPVRGKPFLTGSWTSIPWPGGHSLDIGTPQLFDAGVYLTVIGVIVLVLLTLTEDSQ